jgi:hypothetical protein
MPAKEPQTNSHSSDGPSNTHTWLLPDGRHLEIQPGKPLLHRMCVTCNRNFVHDLETEEWYAAYPRMFDFDRLDDVSARWLNEACPGEYLSADAQAYEGQRNGKAGRSQSE